VDGSFSSLWRHCFPALHLVFVTNTTTTRLQDVNSGSSLWWRYLPASLFLSNAFVRNLCGKETLQWNYQISNCCVVFHTGLPDSVKKCQLGILLACVVIIDLKFGFSILYCRQFFESLSFTEVDTGDKKWTAFAVVGWQVFQKNLAILIPLWNCADIFVVVFLWIVWKIFHYACAQTLL